MQPAIATVANNAAMMQDATNATNNSNSQNNAATMHDATNAPTKATVGTNAATMHEATNATDNSNSRGKHSYDARCNESNQQ